MIVDTTKFSLVIPGLVKMYENSQEKDLEKRVTQMAVCTHINLISMYTIVINNIQLSEETISFFNSKIERLCKFYGVTKVIK